MYECQTSFISVLLCAPAKDFGRLNSSGSFRTPWTYPTNVEIWARIYLKVERKSIRGQTVAGRFAGWSDLEWKLFVDLLPQPLEKRGRGMPHVPCRPSVESATIRTDYWLQMEWCTTRFTVGIKKFCPSMAGAMVWRRNTTENQRILALAAQKRMSDWKSGAVDGCFSPW